MLKHVSRLVLAFLVLLLAGTTALAIPKAIEIPEALMEGKLLSTHRKQIVDRIQWWKKSLVTAKTDAEIQRACKKLLGDYLLYPNANYQQAFAEETIQNCKDVLDGQAVPADDPLRDHKILNLSLTLVKMPQSAMQDAFQTMTASKNEGGRYYGWKGYLALRPTLLNGKANALGPWITATTQAAVQESNPILLSMIYRVMNLGTIEEKVNEKNRLAADAAFLQALQTSWADKRKRVQAATEKDNDPLSALRNAVLVLRSLGEDFARQEPKDDKSVTLCLQMILDLADSTAKTFDRAWKRKEKNRNLLDQCTNMLRTCEQAMNNIAGTEHHFLAEKTNTQNNVPGRGAAVLEAILNWSDALKDKGVKEPTPPK